MVDWNRLSKEGETAQNLSEFHPDDAFSPDSAFRFRQFCED